MIVGENDGCCALVQTPLYNLAGVDAGTVDGALGQHFAGDDLMAVVEEYRNKMLVAQVAEPGPNVTARGIRIAEYRSALQFLSKATSGQFHDRLQLRKFGGAQSAK